MTAIQGDPASVTSADGGVGPDADVARPTARSRTLPRGPAAWHQMTSSFHHRNYLLFFFGQLISVIGTWMQTIAQSFLVLDLTHSGTQLGLTTAARFLPILIFGQAGGLFADRRDKRRILLVTQTSAGLLAGVFAVLTGTHEIRLWSVYLLAIALGFVNVYDNPARQAFISEMVPPEDIANAVTLNSVSVNMARVFGAAIGGVLAAIGLTLCFALNAVSFGAVLLSLALMSTAALYPARPASKKPGQIRAGLRYVKSTPALLIPLIMIAVVGTLAWEFQVSLPLMASHVFGGGAAAYGVMASVMGVGAVAGGLVSAARARPSGRALCLASIGWGIAILRGRGRAVDAARAGGAAVRRIRLDHVQLDGQDGAAARRHAGDARPGDGAVGAGLARLDPDRRADRRLGRPGGGRPLVARGRRRAHPALRSARAAGAGQDRPSPRRPVAAGRGDAPLAALIYPERSRGFARSAHYRSLRRDQRREYHHRAEVMPGGVVERPAAGDNP